MFFFLTHHFPSSLLKSVIRTNQAVCASFCSADGIIVVIHIISTILRNAFDHSLLLSVRLVEEMEEREDREKARDQGPLQAQECETEKSNEKKEGEREQALVPPLRHHLPQFLLPREELGDLLPMYEDGCMFSARKIRSEAEEGKGALREGDLVVEKMYGRVRVLCGCLLTLTVCLKSANDCVREDFRKKFLLPLSTALTCKRLSVLVFGLRLFL